MEPIEFHSNGRSIQLHLFGDGEYMLSDTGHSHPDFFISFNSARAAFLKRCEAAIPLQATASVDVRDAAFNPDFTG